MLISFSGRTKQILFSVIKLEPQLLSWLQPRKINFAPTELDVSISAIEITFTEIYIFFFRTLLAILHLLTIKLVHVTPQKNVQKKMGLHQGIVQMGMEFVV